MGYDWQGAVSDEEALTVTCRLCGVLASKMCVYVWPKGVNPSGTVYSADIQRAVDRVGTPCRRVHNERRSRAWHARNSRRRRTPVTPVSRARLTAALAEREFDAREYEALRTWLSRYARILIDVGE